MAAMEEKKVAHCTDEKLNTQLLDACVAGQEQLVMDLLAAKASVNYVSQFGNCALSEAAMAGHANVVDLLIEKRANVNPEVRYGWTPLMYAADSGRDKIARTLLMNGADADTRTVRNGSSALLYAVRKGHLGVVRTLMDFGASCDQSKLVAAADQLQCKDMETVKELKRLIVNWNHLKADRAIITVLMGLHPKFGRASSLHNSFATEWAFEPRLLHLIFEHVGMADAWPEIQKYDERNADSNFDREWRKHNRRFRCVIS